MIGLLTPYAVQNYGTKLQAYAVQELIYDFDEVEIINFRPNFWERVRRKIEKKKQGNKYVDTKGISEIGNVPDSYLAQRERAIASFDSKLNITQQINGFKNLKAKSRSYNAVVCGSDQIWNPVNLPEHIFMLEFVPKSIRRVAFAPSFGIPKIPEELQLEYRKRLKSLEFISVREATGCNIIRELGFKDVFWSLDPTLILEQNKWEELAKESKFTIEEPYIFCYFLGSHEIGRKIAKIVSKETGFKIVNLPHFKGFVKADEDFADYDLFDVTPQDFIGLIRGASYVCTDSFHGTVFSIIFERQFLCCERHQNRDKASTNDRIYSILNLVGEERRLLKDEAIVKEKIENPIEYSHVKDVLSDNKKRAKSFLVNALTGERNVGLEK